MTTSSDSGDRLIASAYCLPTELWDLILKGLPCTDQQTCLSVSKLFSYLARPLLFSRLTINIGLWKAHNNRNYLANKVQVIERHDLRNTELLQHIARDAQFASVVKEINVRAHDRRGWSDVEHLLRALEALPHLQSFRWYGLSSPFTISILDTLAKICGLTLEELLVSVSVDAYEGAVLSSYRSEFVRLQTLTIAGSSRQFPRHIIPEVERKIKACVVCAPVTLRHLSVSVYSLLDAPLRMLSGLHTLSLKQPRSLAMLGTVLQHCMQLRSLDIVTGSEDCENQILSALEANPDALPHLASFKLLCIDDVFVADHEPFLAFFRNKTGMRRLDLRFDMLFDDVDEYAEFLDIFAGLPQLEVAALMLKGKGFTHERLRILDERLPRGLSALLLHWAFIGPDAVPRLDWIAMLEGRPSLGYLHILESARDLDLCTLLLEDPLPALELVGYGSCLGRIARSSDGTATYGPLWDNTTLVFRTAEDFRPGCEDWEWLLRGHDWEGLHCLEPYDVFKECVRHVAQAC